MSVDVGERSEAVVLYLEEPIRVVERPREAQERHGRSAPAVTGRAASKGVLGQARSRFVPSPCIGGANSTGQTGQRQGLTVLALTPVITGPSWRSR